MIINYGEKYKNIIHGAKDKTAILWISLKVINIKLL